MKRYEWGPEISAYLWNRPLVPGEPAHDVEFTFAGCNETTGEISLSYPAYDPATHQLPAQVYILLLPPGVVAPASPQQAMQGLTNAGFPSLWPSTFKTLAPNPAGDTVVFDRPATAIPWVGMPGKTVLVFEDPDPATSPAPEPAPVA